MPKKFGISEKDKFGLERICVFTDGVFAIAITLLALEIHLPVTAEVMTNSTLFENLLAIWPKYLAYFISFIIISFLWIGHHHKFRYIQNYDGGLIILNTLLLMIIAFIPFPTAIMSEYANSTATIFYALSITMANLLFVLIWYYVSHHNLIDPQLEYDKRQSELFRPLIVAGIFFFSIGLSFIDSNLAKYSWFSIIPALRIYKYFNKRKIKVS